MAIGGLKYKVDISAILKAIEAKKGVVTQITPVLGISHTKFYELLDEYPELKEGLDKARNEYDCVLCDESESALLFALKQREDIGSAIRSAQYVLNNKGRKRGYTPPTAANPLDQASEKSAMEKIADGIAQLRSGQPSKQSTDPDEKQEA